MLRRSGDDGGGKGFTVNSEAVVSFCDPCFCCTIVGMFIRRTRTNNKATGEGYFTYRLVRGERVGGKVRQITVLNLGRNFAIKQEDWPILCSRIEHLLHPQQAAAAARMFESIERAAQRYAGQLVVRAPAIEPARRR
jgi:hypothetical protein